MYNQLCKKLFLWVTRVSTKRWCLVLTPHVALFISKSLWHINLLLLFSCLSVVAIFWTCRKTHLFCLLDVDASGIFCTTFQCAHHSFWATEHLESAFRKKRFSSAPAPIAFSLQVAKHQSSCSMYLNFWTSPRAVYSIKWWQDTRVVLFWWPDG